MNIGSLKPRQVFDIAHKWSKDYVKNFNSRLSKFASPFHIFFYERYKKLENHMLLE